MVDADVEARVFEDFFRDEYPRLVPMLHVLTGEATTELPDADEALWRAVRGLPDQQRWAVVLHYVEDHPVAEVAAVLECSEGTVKTHLSRARATLARRADRSTTDHSSGLRGEPAVVGIGGGARVSRHAGRDRGHDRSSPRADHPARLLRR